MAGGFQIRVVAEEPGHEWLVMLPGAGATSAVWFLQVRRFRKHFNLALVDLPGHARNETRPEPISGPYSFTSLADDLQSTVHAAGIRRCHVVALSLGTILARHWATRHPDTIRSMVLVGTIADLRPSARLLMTVGRVLRRLLPYMLLYRLYAWIIMPGTKHRATRTFFYRDAQSLGRNEFNRWFDLSADVIPLLNNLRSLPMPPTLHVLGEDDHMFLKPAQRLSMSQPAEITVIPSVGHVCSIEAAETFNELCLEFFLRIPRRVLQ